MAKTLFRLFADGSFAGLLSFLKSAVPEKGPTGAGQDGSASKPSPAPETKPAPAAGGWDLSFLTVRHQSLVMCKARAVTPAASMRGIDLQSRSHHHCNKTIAGQVSKSILHAGSIAATQVVRLSASTKRNVWQATSHMVDSTISSKGNRNHLCLPAGHLNIKQGPIGLYLSPMADVQVFALLGLAAHMCFRCWRVVL